MEMKARWCEERERKKESTHERALIDADERGDTAQRGRQKNEHGEQGEASEWERFMGDDAP